MRRFALCCRWVSGACFALASSVQAAAADTKLEVSAQDLFGIIAPMEAQDSSTVDLDFPIIKWTEDKIRISIWSGESTVDPIMDRKVLPLLEDISEATGLASRLQSISEPKSRRASIDWPQTMALLNGDLSSFRW